MNNIKYFICCWGRYEFMTKDKVDGKLMIGGIREEEDKGGSGTLEGGFFFGRKRKQGEIGVRRKKFLGKFGGFTSGLVLLGILGSGARKYDFVELGS
jgi:hypothetical protein